MKLRLFLAAAALLAGGGAYAEEPEGFLPAGEPLPVVEELQPEPAPEAEQPVEIARGIASWYGPRFHGRKTASGERFDMHALTAAHPSLPFGTLVRVEHVDSGRTVDVRINDRGPHVKRRIIDLSRRAAEALGLLGTGRVVLKVLSPRRERR